MPKTSNKIEINFGNKKATFSRKGRKRVVIERGLVMVNGKVKANDGTVYDALLEIDEGSSGEHCGTGIFYEKDTPRIVFQDDKDFLEKVGKTKDEFFPYKYKYNAQIYCYDHHIGENGWSKF